MGSLISGILDALGIPADLAGDNTPYVPSTPVQIGTPGPRHGFSEAGSWQVLIVMLALVLFVGAAVLMFAVRERARVLERRRVRRMSEGAATEIPTATLMLTASAAPRATAATPGRRPGERVT